MSKLTRYPALSKYWAINMYPNISLFNKSALRNLWGDVWHRIGIEWPKNHVPSEKFIKRVYHADSSSLETICQVAKECGLKLINRIDEDEIELVAPGAEDYSVVFAQAHYDNSLNYDYSNLEGLSIAEAIGFLEAMRNKEIVSFDYIYLHFRTPSEFTGLRPKILIHSPLSEAFRVFLMAAKSKLEITAERLYNAVDLSEEPIKSNAQAEREIIMQKLKERCDMMKKRHAFLTAMVKPFNDFDAFMIDHGEWCSIVGIDLAKCVKYLEITIHLEGTDYETYFAVPSKEGHLTISEVIRWQDDYCANTYLNIFSLYGAEENEILTSIHNYG